MDNIEADVGLSRFLTDTPGIGGRLKVGADDFLVEEVPLAFPPAEKDGKYTVARVRAREWETNRLVGEIAKRLGVHRESIYFAGTKDKRAITTQYLAVPAPEAAVQGLNLGDVEILDTRRVDRAPKIGELVGNRFVVRVRDCEVGVDEALTRAQATLDQLEVAGGFPNFFGVQRFGTTRPITHVVGQHLLRGDLPAAVKAYAGTPGRYDNEASNAARELFDEGQYQAAAQAYPRPLDFERRIAAQLAKAPDDWAAALDTLPANLRTMFVYAEQSRLFNQALAARLDAGHGLNEPLVGDLVAEVDADGRAQRGRMHAVTTRNLARVEALCRRGRALVTGGLIGYESPFSGGPMGDFERVALDSAGLTPDDYRVPSYPKVASRGTRRELLAPLGPVNATRGSDEVGDFVELSFFLLKGSYATCLLREVMKADNVAAYA